MLQDLPREILILISDSLDQIQPNNVIDLACVNKTFLSICTPLLQVRTLKFFLHEDEEQLTEDILHYSQLLQSLSGFWAVRRLIIFTSDVKEVINEEVNQRKSQQQWQRPKISALAYRGHENDVLGKFAGGPGSMKYKDTVHQKNHLWLSLAQFILQLPCLESVFYCSYYQLPPCLLDSIQQHRSQCRLYITRFALWSLGPQGTTDPYESRLLTSSSLHGIGTASEAGYGHIGRTSDPLWKHVYLTQALRDLVSGLTPQLKKLVIIGRAIPGAPARYYNPPPWIGFTQQPTHEHHERGGGLLDHLEIRENNVRQIRQNTREEIEKWNQDTDFSALKTLKIGTNSTLDALQYMTTNCQFPSLTELSINFKPNWNRMHPSNYYSAASLFLLSIPALSSLELHSWHPKLATESILKHHGPRLQRLLLRPCRGQSVPLETLHHLAEHCPFVEELTIRISRSRGNIQEVAKYKTIGALPRLKRLSLRLDASDLSLLDGYDYEDEEKGLEPPETRSDASFNSFDQQYCDCPGFFHYWLRPRNGHVRDAFINAALDQDLAKSIFQTIRSDNNTDGQESCPLEFLELRVRGAGELSWDVGSRSEWGFHTVLHKMSRTHRVIRKKDGEIEIEVGDKEEEFMSRHSRYKRMTLEILPFAFKVYQRVWPPKNEHWFDDWHSFPLALSAEDEIDWSKDGEPLIN